MAFCTSCGAELTGEVCSQCGAPATGAPRRRGMNPVLKWALISFGSLVGVMVLAAILIPIFEEINHPYNRLGALYNEYHDIQTTIQVLMVDNGLSQVTPSTSGAGGEKIRSTGAQFHPTINLSDYMDLGSTQACYRWDATGRITFQYDYDDAGNCSTYTDQLYP